MIDEHGKSLWDRVCATVNRMGQPRSPVRRTFFVDNSQPKSIDLHGMTISQAWAFVREFIAETPHRDVTIITGQGRISWEIRDWLMLCPRHQSTTELNGGGAYRVRVRSRYP